MGKTTQHDGYTMTDMGTIKLGRTTYKVEAQHMDSGTIETWLTGPRGGVYFLRPFMEKNGDSGLRQIVPWGGSSGQPLRDKTGKEIRVIILGDHIELVN